VALSTWEEFLPALIQARQDKGMTQAAVAEELGVVASAVSLWERQTRIPTQENAERWAEVMEVKLPGYASLWFRRKERSKVPRHGTRNGYNWHRTHDQMPACDPCKAAAAEYAADWKLRRGER
jgi:transcriptional regulator with XRE-family HTH domain